MLNLKITTLTCCLLVCLQAVAQLDTAAEFGQNRAYSQEPSFKAEGGVNGGGGVGFLCRGRVYLADSFEMIRSGELNARMTYDEIPDTYLIPPSVEEVLNLFLLHGNITRDEKLALEESLKILQFDSTCSVEITNDDNITQVPSGCQKVQIASQRNGKVCFDQTLLSKMYPIDKGLLKIHEAYVYAYKKPNEFTSRLRKKLATAIYKESFRALSAPIFLPMVQKVPPHYNTEF